MSIFSRKEADPAVMMPDVMPGVREALRRVAPDLVSNVSVMAANRFGTRNTLEQKKTAHGNLTEALNAAILRVYELAELHRDSTEDLLEAAKRGRADVEAKLEFINQIELSLKSGNASPPETAKPEEPKTEDQP